MKISTCLFLICATIILVSSLIKGDTMGVLTGILFATATLLIPLGH